MSIAIFSVFLVVPSIQNYAWGKPGSSSVVSRLCANSISGFQVDESKTYAELWMGTHPKGPCTIPGSSSGTLSEWLIEHPESIGDAVRKAFGDSQLPYLFKVLSVNKALSIQAHPNKSHAEELHKQYPDRYPDPNHKPEMAIALTPFEALCGFRPSQEILHYFKTVEELQVVVGQALVGAYEEEPSAENLQRCFTALMSSPCDVMAAQLESLITRVKHMESRGEDTSHVMGELLLRLHSQFPGDVGCFVCYFLNHMTLAPGEAIFLGANLPHAYLQGDCIECMACSDNVVRAGLTPKFKDVPTLCGMLNYSSKTKQQNMFSPSSDPDDPCVTYFDPPVPDFTVAKIEVPSGGKGYTLKGVGSASLLLVVEGQAVISNSSPALSLQAGSVVFIAAQEEVVFKDPSSMLLFRAYCKL